MPHLLYIGQTPAEGTGSPVIVLRHLQRLTQDGWKISIVAETGQDAAACRREHWTMLSLPARRPWWPPFRRDVPFLRTVRTWLLAGECQRLMAGNPPDAVLSYLAAHDDFYPEVAVRYAQRCERPLSLLIHDDPAAFASNPAEKQRRRRRQLAILRRAHRCWFVSPELAAACGLPTSAQCILPPIPGARPQFAGWQAEFARRPKVYYAGYVWPAQFPLLGRIAQTLRDAGAELVVVSKDTPTLREFCHAHEVSHLSPFPSNAEALAHLARDAAGIMVSYAETVDEMPWIATSFPSKLVEYLQLGLPCAIVAPLDSAVGRWAEREGYADFFCPGESSRLAAWARDLRTESTWQTRRSAARQFAEGEFNPERIQAVFASALLRN